MALGALTALQAAFAGLGGGIEGAQMYRQREEARKRQLAADARQEVMDEIMLRDKRFRPAEELAAARQPTGEALSRALSSATAMMRPGSAPGATMQPGDIGRIAQGQALSGPQETFTFGGRQFTREPEEAFQARTEERKAMLEARRLQQQQDLLESRQKAANERANRGYFAVLQRAKELPEGVTYEDMQDIDLKPFFDEYKQAQSAEAAMQRATLIAGAQRGMVGSFQTGIDPATGQPTIIGFTRGGQAVSTGVQSPQQLGKGSAVERRNIADLQASITELDKAIDAVKRDPTAFGLQTVAPNVILSRQPGVKTRADVTRAIVKLRRTEFGTAQSKSERESGVSLFPDKGDEAQAVLDKLQSLKEKAQIELEAKKAAFGMTDGTPTPPAAPTAQPTPARPAVPVSPAQDDVTFAEQWMDANPKRGDETPEAYSARVMAAVRSRRRQ